MNFVIYYYFFSLYVFNAVQPNRVFSEIKVNSFLQTPFVLIIFLKKLFLLKEP